MLKNLVTFDEIGLLTTWQSVSFLFLTKCEIVDKHWNIWKAHSEEIMTDIYTHIHVQILKIKDVKWVI